MPTTDEQIEVCCEVAREKINAMSNFGRLVTDEQIRAVVVAVLDAAENVLGGGDG